MTQPGRIVWLAIFGAGLCLLPSTVRGQNPAPIISQPLFPEALAPGGPTFILTVNGTGFVPSSLVNWNGAALVTKYVSSGHQLKATVPSANIASPGTASITVSSGGVISNVAYFEVTSATSSVSFNNTFYAVGATPYSVAVGDFNGDGKPDLAVTNYSSFSVSVLLGNGEGTFQPAVNYATGNYPFSVAVGDFNGDGKLDLVVANFGGNSVSVLLGNGDGTFQPAVLYAAGSNPISVAVGDFNGDGKLDLAVADYANFSNVSVLLGNGDGTFQPAVSYASGSEARSVAVGDFNGDGQLDLAVANDIGGIVSVLLGKGDGTFQPPVNYFAGASPSSVAVGDFNGDGKLDLAVANNGGGNISVLLGNGDGSFQTAVNYAVGNAPVTITVGDFNGDGTLDLAVSNQVSNNVSVLLGNGDGTLQPALNFPADPNSFSVAMGDFNGDGRMDLAVANANANNVSILLQPSPPLPPPSTPITDVTAGTGLSGGGTSGDVILNSTGVLSLSAGNGLITTGGQSPTLSLNTAVTDARYLQLTGGSLTGGLFAPSFTGSGAGLTNLNPAGLSGGTAGISVTGNAATATVAATATNATNALALGGVLPSGYAPASGSSNYIQNNSGPAQSASLNISGNASVGGNTNVTGNLATGGKVTIGGSGTAITEHLSILVTPAFPLLKGGTCASANFALAGSADGDTIALGVPYERMIVGATLIYSAWVSAPNTVTVQACDIIGSQKTAGTGSIRIDLWKH